MSIMDIWEQVKTLSPEERKELIQLLIDLLAVDAVSPQHRLTELRGLGKEIWQAVDAQDYINQLRAEWDKQT